MSSIFIVSGPAGVGKSSVCKRLLEGDDIVLSISATSRPPRGQEQDGVHYHFISREEFERRRDAGEFLEWAIVHKQHYYGTLAAPVHEALAAGRHVLLEIDVQGAEILREKGLEPVTIFLDPPSKEELLRRLTDRGDTSPEQVAIRMQSAEKEMAEADRFDRRVVNDDLQRCVDEIRAYLAGL